MRTFPQFLLSASGFSNAAVSTEHVHFGKITYHGMHFISSCSVKLRSFHSLSVGASVNVDDSRPYRWGTVVSFLVAEECAIKNIHNVKSGLPSATDSALDFIS